MTPKQAEKVYGKEKWKGIEKHLDGCTIIILPNGEEDIPQEDIENALKEMKGEPFSWD